MSPVRSKMQLRRETTIAPSGYTEVMWRSRCPECSYTYRCQFSGPVFAWTRRHIASHRREAKA